MNGRKVVVQVDFIENYIEVSLEPVTSYSVLRVCVHILIIAPLNPFVIVSDDMGQGKARCQLLPSQNNRKPESKAPTIDSIDFFSDGACN